MLLKMLFRLMPCAAIVLAWFAGAVPTADTAWSADLRLRPKPPEEREAPSDWRTRLFEEYKRFLKQQGY